MTAITSLRKETSPPKAAAPLRQSSVPRSRMQRLVIVVMPTGPRLFYCVRAWAFGVGRAFTPSGDIAYHPAYFPGEANMAVRRITFSGWVACLVLLLAAGARGANDVDAAIRLDSLVYSSDLVVEGRIVEPIPGLLSTSASVRVTAVYRGSVQVGQSIVVRGILDHRKPCAQGTSDVVLGPKDHLLMFLKKADPRVTESGRSTYDAFVSNDEFGDVPATRLLIRGGVYYFVEKLNSFGFSHGFPSPPYIASMLGT